MEYRFSSSVTNKTYSITGRYRDMDLIIGKFENEERNDYIMEIIKKQNMVEDIDEAFIFVSYNLKDYSLEIIDENHINALIDSYRYKLEAERLSNKKYVFYYYFKTLMKYLFYFIYLSTALFIILSIY